MLGLSSCLAVLTLLGGAQAPMCASADLAQPQPQVTRAVIVQHGTNRNADSYFDTMLGAVALAEQEQQTLVIAPHFQETAPKSAPKQLEWDRWAWGEDSLGRGARARSSFEVYDTLLAQLRDAARFPNLTEIVLAGHSAGGQFVQRYAALGKAASIPGGPKLRFVVANPSSYAYLTAKRVVGGKVQLPKSKQRTSCWWWDEYGYGLGGRSGYVAWRPVAKVRSDYLNRSVTYMIGLADTRRDNDLDVSCGADLQGRNRLARARNFHRVLTTLYPKHQHRLVGVPGVGHSSSGMFQSQAGLGVLFPALGPPSAPAG